MRTIGLDLAVHGAHKAVIADTQGQILTGIITLHTRVSDLDALLERARASAPDALVRVVMEPTGMAAFPVATYLIRRGVIVYLVNAQEVADLRRYYQRHAKSDRIDARVLVRLPFINPDKLHQLHLPSATALACQRGCKELDRLMTQIVARENRLQAVDRFAWPGLEDAVFPDPFTPAARFFRAHCYDPRQVAQAGALAIRQHWQASQIDPADDGAWAERLVTLACEILTLYGAESPYLDWRALQAEVGREQTALEELEQQQHTLGLKTVRPLYRQLHPSRNLETIKGVGQDGAAVYASFIGDPQRFGSLRSFRGWSGMVPNSAQSGDSEASGLHITQAGPDLIKKFAYLNAELARRWDPQIVAIYYAEMVQKGKHHKQAVCACATHLLDRVLTVLRADRPYELRDVDGTPVSVEQAQAIITTRYQVPEVVRKRATKRQRQARKDQRAERTTIRNMRATTANDA